MTDHNLARRIFEEIRERPYQVPTRPGEVAWECSAKAQELVKELAILGYDTRIRIADMDWYDSPIPRDILDLHPKDRPTTHFYPEVLIDGAWRLIDPSIDSALVEKGFRLVGFEGDPRSCFTITRVYNSAEQLAFAGLWTDPAFVEQYFRDVSPFLRAVHDWFEQVRQS